MIAVDASAICAIAFNESDRDGFLVALRAADGALVSPVNKWEATVSIQIRRPDVLAERVVHDILTRAGVEVAEIGATEAGLAFEAWRNFGKGHHPARLNLGDCFAYALAKSRGLPLLYKGDDFAKTDVRPAL